MSTSPRVRSLLGIGEGADHDGLGTCTSTHGRNAGSCRIVVRKD